MKNLNLELFNNCESAEEIRAKLAEYIEKYYGHVVKDYADAEIYFCSNFGCLAEDVYQGETIDKRFTLDKAAEDGHYTPTIHIRIEEVFTDSGSVDYCYIVTVEEE